MLILASASPRRAQILRALGLSFQVVPASIDERALPGEDAAAMAERLACEKAACVASAHAALVVAADTTVTCEGERLGKPASIQDAERMLRRLSGRTHEVVTGLCLRQVDRSASGVERTRVRFAPLSDDQIRWYAGTGEPLDKAGAYHIDGRGALLILSIEGSPSNVAGLPVRLLAELTQRLDVSLGWP